MADLDDINKNIQLGNLGKLVDLQQRREQITQDAEILDELKKTNTEKARLAALPKCPFCKKPCEHSAILCGTCRSEIAYLPKTRVSSARFVPKAEFQEALKEEVNRLVDNAFQFLKTIKSHVKSMSKYSPEMEIISRVWHEQRHGLDELPPEEPPSSFGCGWILWLIPFISFCILLIATPIGCIQSVFSDNPWSDTFVAFIWLIITGAVSFFGAALMSEAQEKKEKKELEYADLKKQYEEPRQQAAIRAKTLLAASRIKTDPKKLIEKIDTSWRKTKVALDEYHANLKEIYALTSSNEGLRNEMQRKIKEWPSLKSLKMDIFNHPEHGIKDYSQVQNLIRELSKQKFFNISVDLTGTANIPARVELLDTPDIANLPDKVELLDIPDIADLPDKVELLDTPNLPEVDERKGSCKSCNRQFLKKTLQQYGGMCGRCKIKKRIKRL